MNCEKCQKVFSTESALNRHLTKRTPCVKTPQSFECDLCDLVFETKSEMYSHKLKELNELVEKEKLEFEKVRERVRYIRNPINRNVYYNIHLTFNNSNKLPEDYSPIIIGLIQDTIRDLRVVDLSNVVVNVSSSTSL